MQEKLVALRKARGLTQKDLADLIGVDLRTYKNKEQGHSQFKVNEMFTIAVKLGAEIGDIFLPTNFMNREVSGQEERK